MSLKTYDNSEINDMIHLRGLEKEVLDLQVKLPLLTYYQPQTSRLSESLRLYQMDDVYLDYSHLDSSTNSGMFARDGKSKDYCIAKEILKPNLVLKFEPSYNGYLALIPRK